MSEDKGRHDQGQDGRPDPNSGPAGRGGTTPREGVAQTGNRIGILGLGAALHLILLVTAVHTWVIGWPGKVWVSVGVALAIGVAVALFRKWPAAPGILGGGALGLLLLVPAFFYGVDGAGLPIALVPFPTVASVLFLLSLGLSGWIFLSITRVPLWARLVPLGLGVYAATPVVLGLVEGLPFGEVLVGLWTWPYWIQGAWIGAAVILPFAGLASLAGIFTPGVRPSRFSRKTATLATGGLLGVALLLSFEMNVRGLGNLGSPLGPEEREVALHPSESETPSRAAEREAGDDAPTTSQDRKETLQQHLTELEEGFAQLAEVRSPSTIQSLVAQLGTEPEVLLGWVRDSTRWVPYRGALRGSPGVLGERLGNSLDRAWLLYELLRTSSTNARLARGTLEPADARTLLERSAARGVIQPSRERENIADVYAELLPLDRRELDDRFRKQAEEEEEREARVRARVSEQTADLLEALDAVQGNSGDTGLPELEELVREHWWVQVEGDSGWVDFDPSSEDLPGISSIPDLTLEPNTILDLGPDLLHRVEVRLVLEAWTGGSRSEEVVLEYSVVPAEVGPVFLTLGHAPTSADITSQNSFLAPDLFEGIEDASAWQPILLVDGSEILGETFSWSPSASGGEDESVQEEPSSSSGEGASLGGLFGGRSTKRPDQRPKKSSGPDAGPDGVTAEWIEYEIHVPGRSPRTVRRPLFDLWGPSNRLSEPASPPAETEAERLERAMALLGTTDILVIPADLPDGAMEAQVLRGGGGAVQMMQKVLASDLSDPKALMAALGSSYRASSALLALASARRKWSPVQDRTYLSEVNILSQHRWLVSDARGDVAAMEGLDIVANRVSSLPGAQNDPLQLVVQQGVLDTNAEAVLMAEKTPVANMALLHEAASRGGLDWILLQTPEDPSLREFDLPDDIRARIRAELSDGSVALVPEEAVQVGGEPAFGWWKIDLHTGETLGMGAMGWGQAVVQRAQMEGTTRSVTPMWVKAFRATMDMFWCFVKETGSYIQTANASVVGPTKGESEEYVVNSFTCLWTMNCQFFDIGAVPTGAAVCEVVDQFLEVLDELPK